MIRKKLLNNRQRGFSMIELMLVLAILGVVVGGLFSQMNQAQQRAYAERIKLDNMQEARDFVDQFFRDINQIGYPNVRMVDTASASWTPVLTTPATYAWNSAYANDNPKRSFCPQRQWHLRALPAAQPSRQSFR